MNMHTWTGFAVLGVALVVASTASALPPSAPGAPESWSCRGTAKAPDGAAVVVSVSILADGTRDEHAAWAPSQLTESRKLAGLTGASPHVELFYGRAARATIGRAGAVEASVEIASDPERLEGARAVVDVGDREWSAPLQQEMDDHGSRLPRYWGGFFFSPDGTPRLSEALEGASVARAVLRSADGEELAQVRYDFSASARAERDGLFRTAWDAAERATAHPEACVKVINGQPEGMRSIPLPLVVHQPPPPPPPPPKTP